MSRIVALGQFRTCISLVVNIRLFFTCTADPRIELCPSCFPMAELNYPETETEVGNIHLMMPWQHACHVTLISNG